MKIFKSTIVIAIAALCLPSCNKDFLDRPPEDAYVSDNFYRNDKDLDIATRALYNIPWFDFNDKATICFGDAAAGNFSTNDDAFLNFYVFSVNPTNVRLSEGWRSLYVVVAQANSVIRNINLSDGNFSQQAKDRAIAEARFMRGVAYFKLAMLFGPVPIVEDNVSDLTDPLLPRNRVEDVFEFARRDFLYASKHLLKEDQPGRVTQWSAKGELARLYLYVSGWNHQGSRDQQDLDSAKYYAGDVIKNSGLALMKNYADLFFLKNNNNPESLFALQWVDNQTNWGAQNTAQAYFAAEGKLTGVGDGWGSGGASPSMLEAYVPEDSLRRKATFMQYGDHYPELLKSQGGYTYTKETQYNSNVKKYVIGTPDDNDGHVAFMSTSINTYMLRLSEVYLIYAEAILGDAQSTSDPEAIKYFNMVHERAGLDPVSSITFMDIFHESRVEFAMESHHWYNVVRWWYFQPQKALAYLSNQDRGTYSWEDDKPILNSKFYQVNDNDMVFPYPETEVVTNPKLNEEPVPYNFDQN